MPKKYVLKRVNKEGFIKKKYDEALFSINYQNELNASQYEAASAEEGAYLIIAGAGTGKTRTLVYRVARLVEIGYDPGSILLLTFTRKAAREMMNRASVLLDKRCSRVNGGTFHSFANLTLRKYSKYVGLNSGFTILDQSDSEDVINLIRGQLNLAQTKKRFPKKQLVFKVISLNVNTRRPIEDILAEDYPQFVPLTEKFIDIKNVYENYKRRNSLLDYDDLLIYLREFLFQMNAGTKSLLSKINFVMVDEYQDTNRLQADLIKGLTQLNNNIMVVGDDSQSIYAFRGANFKNIMDFPSLFPDVNIIKLEENYRSTQQILNFANHIIRMAVEKYPKELYTRKTHGDLPGLISATNENMQSRFIVERILELREEGVALNDMAVLFRSSYHSFDLEIELNKANIPFMKFGGMKFVETAHIKDIIAFLRITANPNDHISWYRILLLHEGIGPKKAQQIIDIIGNANFNLNITKNALLNIKNNNTILMLLSMLKNLRESKMTPADKAAQIVEYYDPIFKDKYDDFNKRKKDIDIFLNMAENYKSIDGFLSDMAIEPPQDSLIDIESPGRENEFLTLSTIHSAKGLEWHTVFIIHAVDGFFPSSQSIEKLEAIEEERRLMYVATTRAKQHLYISYPMNIFDRHNGYTFSKPSRFIEKIDESLAEEWLLEDED